MKYNRRSIPISVLFILIFTGMLTVRCSRNSSNQNIIISGNIEFTEVDISFKTSGKLTGLLFQEGEEVKKGVPVAHIENEHLLAQRDKVNAILAGAQARADQLKTVIEYQTKTVQGQIDLKKAELDHAEVQLKELLSGSRTQEIEQARASADQAQTEFEMAKKEWDRAQTLYKKGDISTAHHDQYKTKYEGAKASLKKAKEYLALVIEGPRKEDIEAARLQVSKAKAGYRVAEAQMLEIKIKEKDLQIAQMDIERTKAELSLIEIQINDSIAVSPVEGVVLVKSAEAGEVIAAGTPIVTIGDIFHPWLRGYINEPDLDRVRLGSKVKITTDSKKVFWGTLSFISSKAEFTPKQIQTQQERVKLVYCIKVAIDNPRGELKMNMPVDAEIIIN